LEKDRNRKWSQKGNATKGERDKDSRGGEVI
jgi:hypothetical protein